MVKTAGSRSKKLPVHTEVVVVGAGIAGLYAAYLLAQAEIKVLVLEAANYAGGRIQSRPELDSQLGLTLDEGANLINSTDRLAISLMNRFDISYVRRLRAGSASMRYMVAGQLYDQAALDALLFSESREAINAIQLDQDVWQADVTRDYNPKFIDESISHYLGRIGAGPVLNAVLKSFFWSEYGHDIADLNLHVLFDYLEIDAADPSFKLIPNADEAYTVPRGTEQITAKLAELVGAHVRYGQRVKRIADAGGGVAIRADGTDGGTQRFLCEHVVFAAPLHSLKTIDVAMDGISLEELALARASSYANGTKLHLKFDAGFEDVYDDRGILLTDHGEQIWVSSVGQGGAGLLTVLTGPLPDGDRVAPEDALRLLRRLETIAPGLRRLFVGVERSDAPLSYSGSLRPGELPRLGIHEGGPRWTTIGEASGHELQGYLEGALRSAHDGVTRYLLRKRARSVL